jgi:integrase
MYAVQSAGTFKTEKEARARRDLVAGWIAHGLDPKAEIAKLKKEETRRTLAEWSALWLASRVDLSSGAHEAYRRQLKAIVPTLAAVDPLTFTPADAQEWIVSRELAPKTVASYVSTIRLVFDYIGMPENPWRDRSVKLPRQAQEEVSPPTSEHVITILERVPAKAVLPLAVLEQDGLRVGELLSLAFADFDESGRRLRLRRERTKTSRPRWIPLPEWLAEAIARSCPREDRTPDRRIFQGVTDHSLRRWMRTACRDAGIPNYHPHDLRHRRISLWHGQGIPVKEVSTRVGHAHASMTLDVYSHVMPLEEIPLATWLGLIARAERRPGADPVVTETLRKAAKPHEH